MADSKSSSRKKPTGFFVLIFFIIFLSLVLTGALAHYYYNIRNNPHLLILNAIQTSRNLRSESMEITFDHEMSTNIGKWKIIGNSKSDHIFGESYPKMKSSISFDVLGPQAQYDYKNMQFDVVSVEKEKSYIKVKSFPKIFFLKFDSILEKWIEVNSYTIAKKSDPSASGEILVAGQLWNEEFIKSYRKYSFLKIQRKADEEIEGVNSHHLYFTIEREMFNKFLDEYIIAFAQKSTETLGPSQKANIDNAQKSIKEFFSRASIDGDVWIGAGDNYFRKVSIRLIDKGESSDNSSDTFDSKTQIEVYLRNFNSDIEINSPQESMSLEQAFLSVTGIELDAYLFGGDVDSHRSGNEPSDLDLDTDGDGLKDFMEVKLSTDISNPDSDSDGYGDGEEFNNGYNPKGEGKLEL